MTAGSGLVLRDAEVAGRRVDVRIAAGRVAAVGAGLAAVGDEVLDVGAGVVLPGLHDHHIHLLALAAALGSVRVGPPEVGDEAGLVATLRAADARLPAGAWIRAVGYHESVAGPLDRWRLDAFVPGRPVRVQDRSGALWTLSSAGVQAARLDQAGDVAGIERTGAGEPTGRLWRLDAWLRTRLPAPPPDLSAVGELLLRRGVTGVTDATPTEDAAEIQLLVDAVAGGALPQRVVVTGDPGLDPALVPMVEGSVTLGPVKLLLPDHEVPRLDRMLAGIRRARAQGRPVAVHCITREALALTLAALDEVGAVPGDRIEHGAIVGLDAATRLAEMGLTVVTNPGFVAERGDRYLTDVDAVDRPDLWRCRSLIEGGVAVGVGTDAPFARPDPWAAMAAAVERRTPAGDRLGPDEAVTAAQALGMFLAPADRPGGPPRRIAPGGPADLCVLRTPLAQALAAPTEVEIVAVIRDGILHTW